MLHAHKEGDCTRHPGRFFGYTSGSTPILGSEGKYQIPLSRVRFNSLVGEDEIDLDIASLMMPQAVPVATPPPPSA